MALIFQPSAFSFGTSEKSHLPLQYSTPHRCLYSSPKPKRVIINCQDSSSSPNKSEPRGESSTTPISSSSTVAPPPAPTKKQPNSASAASGSGFGPSTRAEIKPAASSKKKQKSKKERASVIRRVPVEKPSFSKQTNDIQEAKEQSKNESAFLLAWLGLGAIILVEGIILAASGFLPEEWDTFFVKYLYPSFTPTVFLFVAGTVAYGVLKYLQNEQFNKEN